MHEELIKNIDEWIQRLEPKGTGIKANNVKGLTVENCRFEGLKTGIDVENSSDVNLAKNEFKDGENEKLISLLKELNSKLNTTPKDKAGLMKIINKIKQEFPHIPPILQSIQTIWQIILS